MNFIVLDTQVIIDLMNGDESIFEALEIYKAAEKYNALIGLTIQSVYELYKKVDSSKEMYLINHFLANKTDFILANKCIAACENLNPEFWDKGKDEKNFEYDLFAAEIERLKTGIKEYYIDQVSCFVASTIGLSLLIKYLLGQISEKYFRLFAMTSDSTPIKPTRDEMFRDVVKTILNSDDFYDKEKSKALIEEIMDVSVRMLTNNQVSYQLIKITTGDIKNAIKHNKSILSGEIKIFDISSSERFVDSFFKHLNRNNEDSIMIKGINFLFNKYIFGRKVSVNDFIDLSNLESIDNSSDDTECFYFTREKIWNEQFADDYAKDIENIYRCKIIKV